MKFVRYGGLSSVRQRGYDANSTGFHSPPARRGIYAFIWPYVEWFLLNGYLLLFALTSGIAAVFAILWMLFAPG